MDEDQFAPCIDTTSHQTDKKVVSVPPASNLSLLMQSYQTLGYAINKQSISLHAINTFFSQFCDFIFSQGGGKYTSAFDANLCDYWTNNRAFQSFIYDEIRKTPYLKEFVFNCGILDSVSKMYPKGCYLLEKIILRIDQPLEMSELAVWHQDFYYVKGNPEVLTVWIPLQDVNYLNGCLSVMPRSNHLGPVAHTLSCLAKKHIPENIYDNEIRYAEMKVGDSLFFHSLLLHSGNMNMSTKTRYSIQIRFSPVGLTLPPNMGDAYLI